MTAFSSKNYKTIVLNPTIVSDHKFDACLAFKYRKITPSETLYLYISVSIYRSLCTYILC